MSARLFETADMRAQMTALIVAIAVATVVTIAERRPYVADIHRWQYTLLVALAGIFLIVQALWLFRARGARPRAALLAAVGGVVLAAAFVGAELFIGPPQRVNAAPGQTYRPSRSSVIELAFPAMSAAQLSPDSPTASVGLNDGRQTRELSPGQMVRVHSYVLRCDAWPAAFVTARSLPKRQPETLTQPTGAAFVSPVLLFPSVDNDGLPLDEFAVPALHREVAVKYYPGLPSRGIDIPFVQLQIKEENGGALFSGVAVSGRALERAGVDLVFSLGKYPVVTIAGSPDPFLYDVGCAILGIGVLVFMFFVTRREA